MRGACVLNWMRLVTAVCAVLLSGWTAEPAQAQQIGVPNSAILTISSDRFYADSAFGRRIAREIEQDSLELSAENRQIEAELTEEEHDLTERRPVMEPDEFRKLTGEIVIQMAEFPEEEIMDDLSLETPFDLLGLFEGRGIAERWNPATGEGPNRVTLYRRAILDYWAENEETLGDIITHVLIHEIGHHFGLSDDQIDAIEAAAD